jgi:hypothetical protein
VNRAVFWAVAIATALICFHLVRGIVTFELPSGLSTITFAFRPDGWGNPVPPGLLVTVGLTHVSLLLVLLSVVFKKRGALVCAAMVVLVAFVPYFLTESIFNYMTPPLLICCGYLLITGKSEPRSRLLGILISLPWLAYAMTLPVYIIAL